MKAGVLASADKRADAVVRFLATVGGVLGLAIPLATVWYVAEPPRTAILDRQDDVRVTSAAFGVWDVSYQAPDANFGWYLAATRQLVVEGWTLQNRWRPDDAPGPYNPIVPLRFHRRVGAMLWEEVVLEPDLRHPEHARMRMQRKLLLYHHRGGDP